MFWDLLHWVDFVFPTAKQNQFFGFIITFSKQNLTFSSQQIIVEMNYFWGVRFFFGGGMVRYYFFVGGVNKHQLSLSLFKSYLNVTKQGLTNRMFSLIKIINN